VLNAAGEPDLLAREGIVFEHKNYPKGCYQKQKMLNCGAVVTRGPQPMMVGEANFHNAFKKKPGRFVLERR
jgi:hypothetical protein